MSHKGDPYLFRKPHRRGGLKEGMQGGMFCFRCRERVAFVLDGYLDTRFCKTCGEQEGLWQRRMYETRLRYYIGDRKGNAPIKKGRSLRRNPYRKDRRYATKWDVRSRLRYYATKKQRDDAMLEKLKSYLTIYNEGASP